MVLFLCIFYILFTAAIGLGMLWEDVDKTFGDFVFAIVFVICVSWIILPFEVGVYLAKKINEN